MKPYLDLMRRVLETGETREDRTGFGTRSLFGEQLKFDLRDGFPAVTTKRLAFKGVAAELCAFLRGYDTLEQFHSVGCAWWDGNCGAEWWQAALRDRGLPAGYLGRIYGVHWRRWVGLERGGMVRQRDQLRETVDLLRRDPWTRRAIVTSWDPAVPASDVCLPSCHHIFQFSARRRRTFSDAERWELDCLASMRSVDVFLGLPCDIGTYALLTHVVANELGWEPGVLTFSLADTHIYLNHIDACREQLAREPRRLPLLALDPGTTIDNFHPDMAKLTGYNPHPPIKADLNV